jgi:hypothetical protein
MVVPTVEEMPTYDERAVPVHEVLDAAESP